MDLPRPFGPYTLQRRLAVGGMAEVYVAKAKGIGGFEKLVAIKVIHPRFSEDDHFIQMLVEEAKLSVLLTHVNVAQTFDLGCIDETYFIVMEFIEGADAYKILKRVAERRAQIPLDLCAYMVAETCHGLDYAHRKRDSSGRPLNIVHRDVSPQNILISFAGEVKLVDFGIAKAALRTGNTEVGVIKGKYYYMSPEQAWADPVDHRSDIFSTGVVLYELLTGEMLYMEDNLPKLLDRVRKADILPPSSKRPEIPPELDAITMRALAKTPEERYPTGHDLAQALTQFLYRHHPTFTAARLSSLMSQLFPEEMNAATGGAHLASAEKVLPSVVTANPALVAPMQQGEFQPDPEKSVIFDLGGDYGDEATSNEVPRRKTPAPHVERDEDETFVQSDPEAWDALLSQSRQQEFDDSPFESKPPGFEAKFDSDWDDATLVDNSGAALRDLQMASARKAQAQAEPAPRLPAPATPPPRADRKRLRPRKPRSAPPPPLRHPDEPSTRPLRRPSRGTGEVAAPAVEAVKAQPQPVGPPAPTPYQLKPPQVEQPQLEPPPPAPPSSLSGVPWEGAFQQSGRDMQPPTPTPWPLVPGITSDALPSAGVGLPDLSGWEDEGSEPRGPEYDRFAPPPQSALPTVAVPALQKKQTRRWLLIGLGGLIAVGLVGALVSSQLNEDVPIAPSVEIVSVPPGASVSIGGAAQPGVTPIVSTQGLVLGESVRVEVRLPGYELWSADFVPREGPARQIAVLAPERVDLRIATNPPGARVTIDGVFVGNAPVTVPSVERGDVMNVAANLDGYNATETEFRLEPEADPSLTLTLTARD